MANVVADINRILPANIGSFGYVARSKMATFNYVEMPAVVTGNTWYIDPGGNDTTGTGLIGAPWARLRKATDTVTTVGDTIHINAGTYIEASVCTLATGVNIVGDGLTSIIKAKYTGVASSNDAFLVLQNGTNSQSLSNFKMDGSTRVCYRAIVVNNRSNVEFNNLTMIDFNAYAIKFTAGPQTGNSVHDCSISNSGGYISSDEVGSLELRDNVGLLVYNNTITNNSRALNDNGICIRIGVNMEGLKLYNNTINGIERDALHTTWCFAIELWAGTAVPSGYGTEFYGNTIRGCTDFGSGIAHGAYAYGAYIHDNNFIVDTVQDTSIVRRGLDLESQIDSLIICRNHFKNHNRPLEFSQSSDLVSTNIVQNVYIYDNEFMNICYGDSVRSVFSGGYTPHGVAIDCAQASTYYAASFDNINIWNNTMVAYAARKGECGIYLPTGLAVTNINIQNNIIKDFVTAPIIAEKQVGGGTLSTMFIEHNVIYGCGNSNNYKEVTFTATSVTNDLGIKQDPSLVSTTDYNILTNSPAKYAGIPVVFPLSDVSTDINGLPFATPPSIGAYEFVIP